MPKGAGSGAYKPISHPDNDCPNITKLFVVAILCIIGKVVQSDRA
jgi:hypothetical protein